MSSREGAKNWMTFCKHLREAIIDEQKAVPDYKKLLSEARITLPKIERWEQYLLTPFESSVEGIISDEQRHKEELVDFFDKICPRMAVHREGIEAGSGIVVSGRRRISKPLSRRRHHRRAMEGYGR